jgi:hypothetical protein
MQKSVGTRIAGLCVV